MWGIKFIDKDILERPQILLSTYKSEKPTFREVLAQQIFTKYLPTERFLLKKYFWKEPVKEKITNFEKHRIEVLKRQFGYSDEYIQLHKEKWKENKMLTRRKTIKIKDIASK